MSVFFNENPKNKLEYINSLASSGMTRKEIAEKLGYKEVKNLYAFTYRHGMEWNDKKGLYVVKGSNQDETIIEDTPSGKVANIILMFDKKMDGKNIAKKLRFSSFQEMADYMKARGYVWDNTRQNYKKTVPEPIEKVKELIDENPKTPANNDFIGEYGDILKLLSVNRDKLIELFKKVEEEKHSIPRYNLVGVQIIKSVGFTNSLDRLIKEFAEDNNISQKAIFEVALIEFLKKYGYAEQVKAILPA